MIEKDLDMIEADEELDSADINLLADESDNTDIFDVDEEPKHKEIRKKDDAPDVDISSIEFDDASLTDFDDGLDEAGDPLPEDLSAEDNDAELKNFDTADNMEHLLEQEGLAIDDPVRMYLKEIGKVPLLSNEHETELAKRMMNVAPFEEEIKVIEELEQVAKGNAPTAEQVAAKLDMDVAVAAEILRLKKDADDAKSELVEANLRLVVSIAKRYVGRGMYFLDLIQEGNLGLMKAVDKFDYQKGYKFSTYATWWIRQAITRAIADQARTIRIPVHMVETIHKVSRYSRQMLQELGREATPEEIGEKMGMSPEKVRDIMKIAQDPVSLETPIGEEEDSHLGDFIPDDETPAPADAASASILREVIERELHTLTPREATVIKLRFGLIDGRTRTLEEVGKEFDITRERIRQIEAKALRKLRHPSRARHLKGFLD